MMTTGERISRIYNNNGNGIFTQLPGTTFTRICYGYSSFGDYDNDGYPDVLITGQTATFNRISTIYHNNGNGSFTEKSDIILHGLSYSSGAWADFNNDGFQDIVLAGEEAGFSTSTRVYLNNTNGNFMLQDNLTIGGVKKCAVVAGDFDNDGDPDILISGDRNNNPVSELYTNNGDGTFTLDNGVVIAGATESSIGLCDYDNDGDIDFLLTGIDESDALISKIYKNNITTVNNKPGKPSNLSYETDKTTATLRWDKVSGDETSANSLSYNLRIGFTATGSELVSPQSDINGYRKVASIGNAHLNNKFIFKNMRWNTTYYSSVQAIDNSYIAGDFSLPVNFKITPLQPSELTGSNLSTTSLLVKWKRGNGDRCILFAKEGASGISSPVDNTTYFANPVFGDGSPLGTTGWYCIYKGEADSVILSGLVPEKDYTIHAIEFQGTAGSELYATETNPENDNIGVFSSGIFTVLSGISMTGLGASSVAWGDYDNDGYLDILLTGQKIGGTGISKIYRNNGNNTFSEQTEIVLTGVYYGSSSWGDYNNDDLLDIILTGNNNVPGSITKIYKNNGNNSFTEQTGINLTGVYYSSVGWADYDKDGDLDILITGYNLGAGPVSKLYRNEGNNIFTEQTGIQLKGVNKSSVAWGDYDNNGDMDILLTGLDATGRNISRIYRNNGNNTFTEQTSIILTGVSYSSVDWGDYDNDGFLDILLTGASGYIPDYYPVTKIYHNNGNNTFSEKTIPSLTGIYNGSAEWGDYNNDGLLDIFLSGDSGLDFIFKIYLNNGNHGFTEQSAIKLPGAIACSSSSADYDSDGDLDILFSGYSGALTSTIYRNNLYMMAGKLKPNMRPDAPTGLKSEVSPRNLKLTWSGIKTDETFFVNMSYNVRCKLNDDGLWKVTPHSSSDGYRSLNDLGNAQLNRNYTIKDPPSGKYYWQVQAVDQSYSGSEWSEIDSVVIKNTQAFFKTDTVCHGSATNFTDESIVTDGISSWKWDFMDGTASSVQNPVHTYASAGTYNVKLVVTSTAGDKDSLLQNVIIRARPAVSFTAQNVCIGTPTMLTNTTSLNGLTASAWKWRFGDGQVSASADPGTHSYALSGTYKATLKAVAANGCSDSLTKDVIVAKYPETSVSVSGDFETADGMLTFCDGINLQLTAISDPFYTYQWRKDDNDLTGSETNTFTVVRNSGTYKARIINTLANCISITEAKIINIRPAPSKPVIISDNYTTGDCLGENPIKLKVQQAVNEYDYMWLRNGSPVNKATSASLEDYLEQGDYTVFASLNGCRVQSEKFTVLYEGAPEKPLIYAQGPVKWYLACNNMAAEKYLWYYNEKLIDGALKYYYVADHKYGLYRVSIGDSKGCFTRSDTLRIPTDKYTLPSGTAPDEDPFVKLKLYPNPSSGIFKLELENELSGDIDISIISQGGKEIRKLNYEKATRSFSSPIDLSGQTRGVYLINIRMDKHLITKQIILE
jgi:PKD repeat protein